MSQIESTDERLSVKSVLRIAQPAMISVFSDQVGLALLLPTLVQYLRANDTPNFETWAGVILTGQFVANAFGSVAMGYFADVRGSKVGLQVSMLGDVLFFGLTALPYVHPAVLLAIRVCAGLMSPVAGGFTFMFDRLPPAAVPVAVTFYICCVVLAYAAGSIIVATLDDLIGWRGECIIASAFALCAVVDVTYFSVPSYRNGPQSKPEGICRTLATADFKSGIYWMFCLGFSYSCIWQTQTLHWAVGFGFSAAFQGALVLSVPPMILGCTFATPALIGKLGAIRSISFCTLTALVVSALVVIPAVDAHPAAFTVVSMAVWPPWVIAYNAASTLPPGIAASYTINGLGAVTGLFTFAYALGQGFGPFLCALLYQTATWLPWLVNSVLLMSPILYGKTLGLSLFAVPPATASAQKI